MKKYSKDQIREIAADVFGCYPRANSVAVTEDGQAFITDDGDAAVRNHARANRYKEPLEITSFNRSEFAGKPKNDSPKAAKPATPIAAVKKALPVTAKAEAEHKENEQPKKEQQ